MLLGNPIQPIVGMFQQINQERRSTCLKPIIGELQLRQRIKDTEWIVKSYSIIIEMITVILFFQLDVAFLFRQAVPFTQ